MLLCYLQENTSQANEHLFTRLSLQVFRVLAEKMAALLLRGGTKPAALVAILTGVFGRFNSVSLRPAKSSQ